MKWGSNAPNSSLVPYLKIKVINLSYYLWESFAIDGALDHVEVIITNDMLEYNVEFNHNPIKPKGLALGHGLCNLVKLLFSECNNYSCIH